MNLVALDRHSEQARLQAAHARPAAMPLELTVTRSRLPHGGARPARYADGQTVVWRSVRRRAR